MEPEDKPTTRVMRRRPIVALALLAGVFAAARPAPIGRAAVRPLPRPLLEIKESLAQGPHQGECSRCHSEHGPGPIAYPEALVGPNDNTLCAGCHNVAWSGGSFPDPIKYTESSHGQNSAMIWPGPTPPPRSEALAAGKCVNCHDPHGWQDADGEIPSLMLAREEALCLTCHDGSPAAVNIQVDSHKPFRHPMIDSSGRHTGPLESTPSDFGVAPINRRHAECVDCHNPHLAQGSASSAGVSEWSATLRGVSRLLVNNGAAGTAPAFTFLPGSDTLTTPIAEYQLCFKCHSSWTTRPSGQSDLALLLNPNNPSYHPVEAAGTDPLIPAGAFEPGWNAASLTRCGECHRSDSGLSRGPHGSLYPGILPQPYDPSPSPRPVTRDDACFSCHRFATYGDPNAGGSAHALSRFNAPGADKGHAGHAAEEVPCGACHATHGSTTQPHLIVTGRLPGINSIRWSASGATCSPSCHDPESYVVNYGR